MEISQQASVTTLTDTRSMGWPGIRDSRSIGEDEGLSLSHGTDQTAATSQVKPPSTS